MNQPNPSATSTWLKLMGIELSPVSHRERLVSALGGFVGIFAVYWLSNAVLGGTASPLLVLSMGSTAVMLFAVPHGALARRSAPRRDQAREVPGFFRAGGPPCTGGSRG